MQLCNAGKDLPLPGAPCFQTHFKNCPPWSPPTSMWFYFIYVCSCLFFCSSNDSLLWQWPILNVFFASHLIGPSMLAFSNYSLLGILHTCTDSGSISVSAASTKSHFLPSSYWLSLVLLMRWAYFVKLEADQVLVSYCWQ